MSKVTGTTDAGGNDDGGQVDASENFDSFDDLGDNTFQGDPFDFDDENPASDDNGDDTTPLFKRQKAKEEKKKNKGQKGDDLEALDVAEGLEDEEEGAEDEESEDPKSKESKGKKKEDEEEEEESEDPAGKQPKEEKGAKGKKVYLKVGEETFAIDANATIPHKVDGKPVHVPVQELLNNYSGKVAWDKRMNEVNVKNQEISKKERLVSENATKMGTFVKDIIGIIENPESDPDDIFEKIADYYENSIDGKEIDLYAFKERSFKARLSELAKVLNFETDAERKAYFLEKRNENILKQSEKRKQRTEAAQRVTSYRQKTDALRNSYGVSESQYVDALEELKTFGAKDEELTEKEIVEWAATKPHRPVVSELLEPYKDQISDESYGEIAISLCHLMRQGKETKDSIRKTLEEIYGLPTEVQEISKKLSPLGRKKATPPASSGSKKANFESFDDIDEE